MAFVLSDRIKETTTTTGTGTYTLGGAVSGFETFTANLSNSDTTYYCCTDGTDFEVGLGTFTSSGTTLARTTIISSSNSNNAVSWSSGSKDIFCTLPGSKALALDGNNGVTLASDASNPVIGITGSGPNFIRFFDDTSSTNAVDLIYRTTPNDLLIERSNGNNIAEFGGDDGHAALYFDNSKKLETTSGGVTITGTLTGNVTGDVTGNADTASAVAADNISAGDAAINLTTTSGNITIDAQGSDTDIIFKGTDDSSDITALTLDMSNAGAATFNHDVTANGNILAEDGYLGFGDQSGDNWGKVEYVSGNPTGFTSQFGNAVALDNEQGSTNQQLYLFDTAHGNDSDLLGLAANGSAIFSITGQGDIKFLRPNGNTSYDIILATPTPTATRTVTLPDATGTILLNSGNQSISGDLTLTSTDTGSGDDPSLILKRDSSSPADFDNIGNVDFVAENSASEAITVASISGMIDDVTDGTEDGRIRFSYHVNGTHTDFIDFVGNQLLFLNEGKFTWYQQNGSYNISLEGGTPSANRTITLPDATGTVLLNSGDQSISGDFTADEVFLGNTTDHKIGKVNHSFGDGIGLTTDAATVTIGAGNSSYVHYISSTGIPHWFNSTVYTNGNFQFWGSGSLFLKSGGVSFEGSTDDAYETTLNVVDPTADRTINLPNASGNVVLNESGTVNIESTADGGPILNLISNDPSDADDFDVEGTILFKAENSASEETSFAEIKMTTADITDGTEDGRLRVNLQQGGNGLVDSYQFSSSVLFLENDAHTIRWNNTRSTSYEVNLQTATPTATRTITLPDATGTVLTTGNSDTPTTTTSSSDADFVLVDDGGTMKKITPSNLGITSGGASKGFAVAMAIAL